MTYYPYLHGRQAELTAIQATAEQFGAPQRVWPLVEPVDPAPKLVRALSELTGKGLGAYLVVNPSRGALATPTAKGAWLAAVSPAIAASHLVRPTFREDASTTIEEIRSFVESYSGRELGLVLVSDKLAPAPLAAVLAGANVTIFATAGALALATKLGTTVHIRDNFRPQARNADYEGVEWLGNNHVGHAPPGTIGFSDYTILPSAFALGGGPVGAAAIHLTYREEDDSFWVQHFVSDERDRALGTFQSKLLEAIAHLHAQISATPGRFIETEALKAYLVDLSAGSTTNPSMNKARLISHHLLTVTNYLAL